MSLDDRSSSNLNLHRKSQSDLKLQLLTRPKQLIVAVAQFLLADLVRRVMSMNSTQTITAEKRKHPRMIVNLPVKYSRTNLFFKYARVVNASQGGLLVYLPEEIGIGQRLALKLFFPSRSDFNTFETFVQVVWKDVHLRKDWTWDYRTGVRFIDASPEHMSKLKDFLGSVRKKILPTA